MAKQTYNLEVSFIRSLRMEDGSYKRMDCPFCYGRNTFGVTYRGGVYRWGCYRASCMTQGFLEGKEGIESILARVDGKQEDKPRTAPMPRVLSHVENQPQALKWLASVNSLEAHEKGLVQIKYDPVEDRIAFPVYSVPQSDSIRSEDNVIGYTSRARRGVKPKWKKFGDTTQLFTCGTGELAVLVEDAPSACAVGIIPEFTGCSLLGTNLGLEHILTLRKFKQVIVALDPDAYGKQETMVRRIGNARTVLIEDDLKYFGTDDIRRMLE